MRRIFTFLIITSLATASGLVSADGGHGSGKFMRFFDANNDGTVTLDEFNDSAKARFERMDSDGDGKVSKDEFRSYIKARRAEHMERKFARMDADQDGKVSREEFLAYKAKKAERKFARMDKNNDGVISKEEHASCKGGKHGKHKRHGGKIFYHIDKNGDGFITQSESYEAWLNWFNRIDSNADKVVTADEVKAYREQRRKKRD